MNQHIVNSPESLDEKRNNARQGGGGERIALQHKKGKLTARERIEVLLDPESFEETGNFKQETGLVRKIILQ